MLTPTPQNKLCSNPCMASTLGNMCLDQSWLATALFAWGIPRKKLRPSVPHPRRSLAKALPRVPQLQAANPPEPLRMGGVGLHFCYKEGCPF